MPGPIPADGSVKYLYGAPNREALERASMHLYAGMEECLTVELLLADRRGEEPCVTEVEVLIITFNEGFCEVIYQDDGGLYKVTYSPDADLRAKPVVTRRQTE